MNYARFGLANPNHDAGDLAIPRRLIRGNFAFYLLWSFFKQTVSVIVFSDSLSSSEIFGEKKFIFNLNRFGGQMMKEKMSQLFRFLVFLLCPEDSTERYAGSDKMCLSNPLYCATEYAGIIKAVFWIFMSVLISMGIGQLN